MHLKWSISSILGDLAVSGNKMTFNMNAVGECVKDAQNKYTSNLEWFAKGTPKIQVRILNM